jgi:acyl-CoA reductase-like NAD-dependent aldehyde dehydrogenase
LATSTTTTPLLIGGEERPAADSFPVYDPSNGEVIGHAAAASTADALDAVRAAHEAWPAWAALPTAERVQLSLAALAGLESDADERSELLVRENGKTRFEATIDPLVLVGASIRRRPLRRASTATMSSRGRVHGDHRHVPWASSRSSSRSTGPRDSRCEPPVRPHGRQHRRVKPPPTTPMSVVRTLRHIALALPPGVLNVVTGADAVSVRS